MFRPSDDPPECLPGGAHLRAGFLQLAQTGRDGEVWAISGVFGVPKKGELYTIVPIFVLAYSVPNMRCLRKKNWKNAFIFQAHHQKPLLNQ